MTPENNRVSTSNVMPSESQSIQDRINIIIELDKKIIEIDKEIKDKGWDSLKDSRMLFIRYISELNSNTILQMSFQAESHEKPADKEWLKARMQHLSEQIDSITNIRQFSVNMNNHILRNTWDWFIFSYFFEFESRIRSIVRNIGTVQNVQKTKSKKPLNGNESFYLIYRGLYESFLKLDKSQYEVLKLFSAIRNTIHNSGFYFSPTKDDKIYNYRGKSYHFKHGSPINFLTSEFIKNIMMDLLMLFSKTIVNKRISTINFIKDPVSNVKFNRAE